MRGPALAAAAFLAGCSAPADEPTPKATETADAAPVASAVPTNEPPVRIRAKHLVILDNGGLSVRQHANARPHFDFGAPRGVVEKALSQVMGEADERTKNDECGAGPMEFTRYGGLTLDWQDGKLVGWLAEQDDRLVTSDGIRPGLRRANLELERSVRLIPDSTLDGEFEYEAADGTRMYGFLTGDGKAQTVRSLYAGTNCFFR